MSKTALAAFAVMLGLALPASADCRFTLNFAYGSSALTRSDALLLHDIGRLYPGMAFELSAHADDDGSPTANARVASARANAVADRLVRAGLTPQRVISVAADWDVIPTTESSSPLNRRVELFVQGCDPEAHGGARLHDAAGVSFRSNGRVFVTRPLDPDF